MPVFSLPEDEQEIMDQLIQEFELPPSLIEKLLSLVTEKHPSLEVWGAKKALERDVAETIQNAAKMRLDPEI